MREARHRAVDSAALASRAATVRERFAGDKASFATETSQLAALMAPLVASQIVEGWNWNPGAFVFVYVLFFGMGMAYALISRKMGAWSYKAGVGLALVTGFVLGWSNMVHVADSENPANLLY